MNSFNVEKVDNGFVVHFLEENEIVETDGTKYRDFTDKTFVFETPAKLKKGLKLIVGKLTKEGE